MIQLRSVLSLSPLRITVGYFVFGTLWIPATDMILAIFFAQPMPTTLGIMKGWVFIGLSAVLIYSLSALHQQQMTAVQTKLETTNEQLQVLHRVFRHNIRNDLNVIHGYTETVSDQISEERLQRQLAVVQQTADQIIGVSEKLKIVERVDPTLSNDQVVDLADLIDSEVEKIHSSYPAVSIETDVPNHAWIKGDESLQYAIREVLENAIIHHDQTTADCEISIRLTSGRETVTLEIADNGPGIPHEELKPLRSQEETPLVHMSSVGLWLVTWFCRLHNGSVGLKIADGTTVTFCFQAKVQFSMVELESPIRKKLSTVIA